MNMDPYWKIRRNFGSCFPGCATFLFGLLILAYYLSCDVLYNSDHSLKVTITTPLIRCSVVR